MIWYDTYDNFMYKNVLLAPDRRSNCIKCCKMVTFPYPTSRRPGMNRNKEITSLTIYWVGQICGTTFHFLLVTVECMHKIQWFLAHYYKLYKTSGAMPNYLNGKWYARWRTCRQTAQSTQHKHPPHTAALCTEWLSTAELLLHTAHSD